MSNSKTFAKIASGLALAGAASFANAAVITESSTFNFDSSSLSTGDVLNATSEVSVSDYAESTINVSGFDASLGTLESVRITFASDWALGGTLTANDTSSGAGDVTEGYSYINASGRVQSDLYIELINPTTGDDFQETQQAVLCSNIGEDGHGGVDCSSSGSTSGTFGGSFDVSSVTDLSAFLDDLTFVVGKDDGVTLTGCSNDLASADPDANAPFSGDGSGAECSVETDLNSWSGTILVEYTYNEVNVPEPATLALFGLGLAGLGFARRKQS